MDDNTVLLRIQLDPGATKQEMERLTKELVVNREAVQALNKERQQGKVGLDEFAKRNLELTGTIKQQARELTHLQKDLDLYNTAVEGTGTSYKATQAALSLMQRQFQVLEGSADNNTEATQALSDTIEAYRQRLVKTDADQGAFHRVIGKYPQLSAEAQASLESLAIELEKLRKEQAEAAKSGGPVAPEAIARVKELESELANAKVANTQYGNSVADLEQKLDDLTAARYFSQDTEQVEQLNRAILETKTQLGQATGVLDEFGERTKKNANKEDIDTLADAFGGVTAAIQLSTLASLDQEQADIATAKATQFLAQAEALRNLQIGIASAKDAGHIIFLKAKNLLFVEGAAATTANTAASAASTAATGAQTAATGGLTIAQRALNLAMTLNPIGLIVVAIGALVGAFYAWRGASESTRKTVADITEKVLRFGTPIGLVVTGLQKLYEKSETVRKILDPLGRAFEFVAGKAKAAAQEAGEAVGLLDTAAEKAIEQAEKRVEAQKKVVEASELVVGKAKEEARAAELAGERIEKVRAKERAGLADRLKKEEEYVSRFLRLQQLKKADGEKLSEEEEKTLQEHSVKLQGLRNDLLEFDIQTKDKIATERKKEIEAAKTDAERQRKLAEQTLKDEYTSRKQFLENRQQQIARLLELTQEGSREELRLLREQAENVTKIQLADNSAAQVGAAKKQAAALVKAREEIVLNGAAALIKLDADQLRKREEATLQAEKSRLTTELAQAKEGSQQRYELQRQQLQVQAELDKAGLNQRQDNAARIKEIEASLQADLSKLATDNAAAEVERQRKELEEKARLLAAGADRMLLDLSDEEEARIAQSEGYVNARKAQILAERDAQILGTREGSAERIEIEQDAARKLLALDEQTAEQRKATASGMFNAFAQAATNAFDSINTIQEAGKNAALARDDAQMRQQLAAAGDNATQRESIERAHAQNKERIEKEFAEKRRKIQIAQALINGAMAVTEILKTPSMLPSPFAQLVKIAEIAFTVATTAAQISAISSQKFAQGGVAQPQGVVFGPAHTQGGVQMYDKSGAHLGEMEGFETILVPGVYRDPRLFAAASALNVAGGGRSLLAGNPDLQPLNIPRYALGGIASPSLIREAVTGNAPVINYDALAEATARALRKNPPINRWQDWKDASDRAAFTESLSSI